MVRKSKEGTEYHEPIARTKFYTETETEKKPFKIKVIGTEYTIKAKDRTNGTAGEFLPSNECIEVREYENKSYMFKTLWHELIHAVLFFNGDDELSNDEGFVQRTSNAIAAILEENEGVADTNDFECQLGKRRV